MKQTLLEYLEASYDYIESKDKLLTFQKDIEKIVAKYKILLKDYDEKKAIKDKLYRKLLAEKV